MSRTSRRAAALAVAVGALVLVGAGPAPAAPAPPDGTHEGLVRATLAANPDSVRLSANEIQLEPGLVMTLPGTRDSATTRQARGVCNYLYFCLYEHAYWGGASLAMSACKIYRLSSYVFWNSTEKYWDDWVADASSWINNQSGGAFATMWAPNGHTMRVSVTSDHHFPPAGTTGCSGSSPAETARSSHRTSRTLSPAPSPAAIGSPAPAINPRMRAT